MERKTGFEPATTTLGRWRSTVELLSQIKYNYNRIIYCLSTFIKTIYQLIGFAVLNSFAYGSIGFVLQHYILKLLFADKK